MPLVAGLMVRMSTVVSKIGNTLIMCYYGKGINILFNPGNGFVKFKRIAQIKFIKISDICFFNTMHLCKNRCRLFSS